MIEGQFEDSFWNPINESAPKHSRVSPHSRQQIELIPRFDEIPFFHNLLISLSFLVLSG